MINEYDFKNINIKFHSPSDDFMNGINENHCNGQNLPCNNNSGPKNYPIILMAIIMTI